MQQNRLFPILYVDDQYCKHGYISIGISFKQERDSEIVNRNRQSYLDNVWSAGGTNRLRQTFNELALRDRQEALRQINDDWLRFPVLFILIPEISAHRLYPGLSRRNMAAMNICVKKIYKYDLVDATTDQMDSDTFYDALKWMFDTGKQWGGPSGGQDAYDSVIDYVSALLVIIFEDKTVLKEIADLIFKRNRRGLYIHDLVWSFFQSLDRDALTIIAGYLLSNHPRDVELASQLLCLDVPVSSNTGEVKKTHRQYLDWLNENKPYLYLTGEHFQMTSKPRHLDADREAKYLGKEISPRYRAPVEPLTENELECLHRYRETSREEQELLTDYSHKLRYRDAQLWYEWMHKQTAEQVMAARMMYEAV